MSTEFKVDDIVENVVNKRICNGQYGRIVSFYGELYVADNEDALDMVLSACKDQLRVVGHYPEDEHLLEVFCNER